VSMFLERQRLLNGGSAPGSSQASPSSTLDSAERPGITPHSI
jgi:hypothetical protein